MGERANEVTPQYDEDGKPVSQDNERLGVNQWYNATNPYNNTPSNQYGAGTGAYSNQYNTGSPYEADRPYAGNQFASNPDNYSLVPRENQGNAISGDQSTEAIKSDIEQTRSELSQTINAIQDKLNPQVVMQQAKEAVKETASGIIDHVKDSAVEAVDHTKQTVHDATVGKVEHMVSNISTTAQETGTGIIDTIKKNPVPAALIGLGLGWFFMKGQNKPGGGSTSGLKQARYSPGSQYNSGMGYYPPKQTSGSTGGAEGITGRVVDSIRQNPIPAAVAGLSIGYMAMQGQSSSKTGAYQSRVPMEAENLGQKVGDIAGEAKHKVGNVAHQAGEVVGDVAHQAGNVAQQAGEKVGDLAGGVGSAVGGAVGGVGSAVGGAVGGVGNVVGSAVDGVGDTIGGVVGGVQHQTERVQTQFGQLLEEKPLAVGAIALAVGMAAGMMLPKTAQEDKILGDARDSLVNKAQEIAQDTIEKVQHVTEEVGGSVKTAVEDVKETAKTEAHNQGLAM